MKDYLQEVNMFTRNGHSIFTSSVHSDADVTVDIFEP